MSVYPLPTCSGTSPPSGKSMLVKVVVPATVGAVVLVTILVIVVVVGLFYIYKKRSRAFSFQRMTFSSINDEEEDEE